MENNTQKTWRFSLLLVIAIMALACGDGRFKQTSMSQIAKSGQEQSEVLAEWVLSLGQSIRLESGETLTFSKVLEDSRCPEEVVCIWEGRISLEFFLESEGRKRRIELGLGQSTEQAFNLAGTQIQLNKVSPEGTLEDTGKNYQVHLSQIQVQLPFDVKTDLEGVRLATHYDSRIGVVELEVLNGRISLIQDRNRCRINQFGERFACTKMAVMSFEVDLKFIETNGDTKYLYLIDKVEDLTFVIDKANGQTSYSLIVENRELATPFVKAMLPVQKIKMLPSAD